MEPIAEFAAVEKRYRTRLILDSLSFVLNRGEMVAVTGPSGVGKTTVLNLLGCLDRPDAGEIHLFGEPSPPLGSGKAMRLLRYRLGYVFQNFALIADSSVEHNLTVSQTYVRGSAENKRHARLHALADVGLAGISPSQKIYALSGGEQQRVALARLLLKPCELILADEPTGSLDTVNAQAVLDIFRSFRSQSKTVVIVTHNPEVASACDREIRLASPGNSAP